MKNNLLATYHDTLKSTFDGIRKNANILSFTATHGRLVGINQAFCMIAIANKDYKSFDYIMAREDRLLKRCEKIFNK